MGYRDWDSPGRTWFWVAFALMLSVAGLAVALAIVSSRLANDQSPPVPLTQPEREVARGMATRPVGRRGRVALILKGRAEACWCKGKKNGPGFRGSMVVVPHNKRAVVNERSMAYYRETCGLSDPSRCTRVSAVDHIAGVIQNVIRPLEERGYRVDVYLHLEATTPPATVQALKEGLSPVWTMVGDVNRHDRVESQWMRAAEAMQAAEADGDCAFVVIGRPDFAWLAPLHCPQAETHAYMGHRERWPYRNTCDTVVTIPGQHMAAAMHLLSKHGMWAQAALSRQLRKMTGNPVLMVCSEMNGKGCGTFRLPGTNIPCGVIDGGQTQWQPNAAFPLDRNAADRPDWDSTAGLQPPTRG
jgi:hypothetical protein